MMLYCHGQVPGCMGHDEHYGTAYDFQGLTAYFRTIVVFFCPQGGYLTQQIFTPLQEVLSYCELITHFHCKIDLVQQQLHGIGETTGMPAVASSIKGAVVYPLNV